MSGPFSKDRSCGTSLREHETYTDEEYQERCETYEAALEQHKRACQHIGIEIGKVVSELEKDFMENLKKI